MENTSLLSVSLVDKQADCNNDESVESVLLAVKEDSEFLSAPSSPLLNKSIDLMDSEPIYPETPNQQHISLFKLRPQTAPHLITFSTDSPTFQGHLFSDPFPPLPPRSTDNSSPVTLFSSPRIPKQTNPLAAFDAYPSSADGEAKIPPVYENELQSRSSLVAPSSPTPNSPANGNLVINERLRDLIHDREEQMVDALVIEQVSHQEVKLVDLQHHNIAIPTHLEQTLATLDPSEVMSHVEPFDQTKYVEKSNDGEELVLSETNSQSSWHESVQVVNEEEKEKDLLSSLLPESTLSIAEDESKEFSRPNIPEYTFAWSVATQKGYRYRDMQSRDKKLDIHARMEDMHFPSYKESPNQIHEINGRPFQVFVLADGHGGYKCAEFVIKYLPHEVIALVNSRDWNIHLETDREMLQQDLQNLFVSMDDYYCNEKLKDYRRWIQESIGSNCDPFHPSMREDRPADDGCTCVVNIFYDGFFINANVGDSRTLLLGRDLIIDEQKYALPTSSVHFQSSLSSSDHEFSPQFWRPVFASTDHTPGHPEKAHQIHVNGGRFIMNGATAAVHDLLSADKALVTEETYDFLSRCRIGRQVGWRIEELDYPAFTTLNLAGTIGDLFFKYSPPLLSAKPDVSFVPLDLRNKKYLLTMASDGLWDHMAQQDDDVQHAMIASYIDSILEHSGDFDDSTTISFKSPQQKNDRQIQEKLQRLGSLAHGLADREMTTCNSNLYAPNFIRYDDVTVFVVLIEGGRIADVESASDEDQTLPGTQIPDTSSSNSTVDDSTQPSYIEHDDSELSPQ